MSVNSGESSVHSYIVDFYCDEKNL